MEFAYTKFRTKTFFSDKDACESVLEMETIQSYIPIYKNFFKLSDTNSGMVGLDNTNRLEDIGTKLSYNRYTGTIRNGDDVSTDRPVFFKFSPLLDPIKYMIGRYTDDDITNLPQFGSDKCHPKMADINNLSYVDGFFTYLTSRLLHIHGFEHSVDYYGAFIGVKQSFEVDIRDDTDYLHQSDFFHDNVGTLFQLDDELMAAMMDTSDANDMSRRHKRPIQVVSGGDISAEELIVIDEDFSVMPVPRTALPPTPPTPPLDRSERKYTFDMTELPDTEFGGSVRPRSGSDSSGASTCSSQSSVTRDEVDADGRGTADGESCSSDGSCSSEGSYDSAESSGSESSDDEGIICSIDRFPVQAIALEACDGTLDDLFLKHDLATNRPHLRSAMFQIIMSLIVYQKAFGLTHNDLHTNNVVYCETDKKFLFYRYNDKCYRVPTYGRIIKIIDFGRAIYRFRGKTMCSDSYHPTGDAGSQYNCEPFFNPAKPRLDPHFGFDLVRLGCSLYELVDAEEVDSVGNIIESKLGDVEQMIVSWCRDDKGRNILYKSDGDERYPGFKLYKMIARTAHKHLPTNEIEKPVFHEYIVPAKKCKKQVRLMDIDAIPDYTGESADL
jgi:serine/threonine protein kinase